MAVDDERIQRTWRAADKWRSQGNQGREQLVVHRIVLEYARASLQQGYAERWQYRAELARALRRLEELLDAGVTPPGVWNVADVAVIWGSSDLSRRLLEAMDPADTTPFWRCYSEAQLALHKGERWTRPPDLQVKAYNKFLLPYLELAERLSAVEQPGEALMVEIQQAFEKRNSQGRLHDPVMLDGDKQVPVAWDLRKEATMARGVGAQ